MQCSEPKLFSKIVSRVILENPSWLKNRVEIEVSEKDNHFADVDENYYDMLMFTIELKPVFLADEQTTELTDIVQVKGSINQRQRVIHILAD